MTRGGKRKGSGQKSQYREPTVTIAFRVPESKKEFIQSVVKKHLEKFKIKK